MGGRDEAEDNPRRTRRHIERAKAMASHILRQDSGKAQSQPGYDREAGEGLGLSEAGEVITLPWPHPSIFPNAKRRLHWSKYQPHCNRARVDAKLVTRGYLNSIGYVSDNSGSPVPMRVTFHPPNRIRRDDDGMIGAFKHYRDGIADGLGIDDQLFRPQYTIAEPVKGGMITVEIG